MKNTVVNILFLLILASIAQTALAEQEESNIFTDPKWFPVNERSFSILYETDELGYRNHSLVMRNTANDNNIYMGGSLDYMEFITEESQFAIYGHIGYRPKWRLAPYIEGEVDLYSTLIELIGGNGLKLNSRIGTGLQLTFKNSYIRMFYRASNLDFSHFTTENGTYTSYGVSFGTVIGRKKRWRKNPPVVAFNTLPY